MPVSRNRKNQKQKAKKRNEKVRGMVKKQREYMMKMLNDSLIKQMGAQQQVPQENNPQS